jgi:hypothetical protein
MMAITTSYSEEEKRASGQADSSTYCRPNLKSASISAFCPSLTL